MSMSVDCFSNLPIELHINIVSFLPLKDAVTTSVLSKKLLKFNIYKSIPNIEFDEFFFLKPDQSEETRQSQRRAFLEFIQLWIQKREGTSVKKFSLRLSMPENVAQIVNKCIAFATRHRVKDMELDFADTDRYGIDYFYDYEAKFELPKEVYEHSILESLKLYSCSFIETEVQNFDSLKQIWLGRMQVSFSAIKALLSNCKNLHSLSFERCWNSEKFDLGEEEIVGLTKLVLHECRFKFDYCRVNAPNLKIFKYSGWMNFRITQIHSLAMDEGKLDFSLEYLFHGFGNTHLLKELHTVKALTVCSFVDQVIPTGPEQHECNVTRK